MSIHDKLTNLLKDGHPDEEFLLTLEVIAEFERQLSSLQGKSEPKGYTIPPIDTVGKRLYGKVSCSVDGEFLPTKK